MGWGWRRLRVQVTAGIDVMRKFKIQYSNFRENPSPKLQGVRVIWPVVSEKRQRTGRTPRRYRVVVKWCAQNGRTTTVDFKSAASPRPSPPFCKWRRGCHGRSYAEGERGVQVSPLADLMQIFKIQTPKFRETPSPKLQGVRPNLRGN